MDEPLPVIKYTSLGPKAQQELVQIVQENLQDTAAYVAAAAKKTSDKQWFTTEFMTPQIMRHNRACRGCAIVQPHEMFNHHGCPNCTFIAYKGDEDMIRECASRVFDGTIALSDPERSALARYYGFDKFVVGIYATRVDGRLPDEVVDRMEEIGVEYVPRDGDAEPDLTLEDGHRGKDKQQEPDDLDDFLVHE